MGLVTSLHITHPVFRKRSAWSALIHSLSDVQNYNFSLSCITTSSKYCKMVQADDWLLPDCMRNMVEVAEAHPSVGIVCAYECEDDEIRLDGLPYPSTKVPGRPALFFERHVRVWHAHFAVIAARTHTLARAFL